MRAYLRAKSGANPGRKPALSSRLCRVASNTTMGGEVGGRRQKLVSQRWLIGWSRTNQRSRQWRASLNERDRLRWSSPEVVMREYRRAKRPPAVQDPNAPKTETVKDNLLRELEEAEDQVRGDEA